MNHIITWWLLSSEKECFCLTVTWEKMRTLCPSSLSFFNIFWSSVSFPEDFTRRFPSYEPLGNTGASCKSQSHITHRNICICTLLPWRWQKLQHCACRLSLLHSFNTMPYHSSHREEVGMVAALLQVHHNIEQGHLAPPSFGIQSLKVSCQNKLVIFPADERSEISFWSLKNESYFTNMAHHFLQIQSVKCNCMITSLI